MVGSRPFLFALLLLALVPASAAANTQTGIIVKREAGLSAAERADIRADADVRLVETLSVPRAELVAAAPGDVQDALRDLKADPDVEYAQLNHRRSALVPDPAMDKMWAFANTAQQLFSDTPSSKGFYDADSDVLEAWDLQDGLGFPVTGDGQIVAVVDSGVRSNHEDLVGQIDHARNFVFGESSADFDDGNGHGTHVAGTIAAIRDNGKGGFGVAPGAKVMALRALNDAGTGSDWDIANAIQYAGDNSARIVNLSLGGDDPAPLVDDVIDNFPQTLFVIAAGNDGRDNDVTPTYPCDSLEPNIVCVGASTNREQRADFSNYGDISVDLFAPGESILSTIPQFLIPEMGNAKYAFFDGTSMAAPHVAAVAALVLQTDPVMDVEDLKDALLNSVDHRTAYDNYSVQGGRLNAGAAVAYALAGGPPLDTDLDGEFDAVDRCDNDPQPGLPEGCPIPDQDFDTVADWDDNCPAVSNTNQQDTPDGDGVGNACDPDYDDDARVNASDNCPLTANPSQRDYPDGDGTGDACDGDRDNDGVANASDLCPEQYAVTAKGCAPGAAPPVTPPADRDGDGIYDVSDACPATAAATANGCPLPQVTSTSAKVRRRAATITVKTTQVATVRITVERKRGGRWVRVVRKTLVTSGLQARIKVTGLKRGSHRVRISVSSSSGSGTPVTKAFRVR